MTRESDLLRRSAEIRKFFRSTTSNKATVTQFLHDVESEVTKYQAEINRLKAAIYALQHKRDSLKRTAEVYKSLLSPIHNVPSEILTMIFTIACERNVLSSSTLPNALRLSMVCGRWRDIVFSTPSLWATIEVDFGTWTKDFHVLNQLSELFIKQSKSSSLRLFLTFPGDDFSKSVSQRGGARPTLRSFVEHCRRWEHMSLTIEPSRFPWSIFEPIRGRLPLLRSLALFKVGSLTRTQRSWHQPFTIFEASAALRVLEISPELFDLQKKEVSLPWSRIETLRLHRAFNATGFSLVSLCTAVQRLQMHEVGGVAGDGNDYSGHLIRSGVETLDIVKALGQYDVDGVLKHTTLSGLSSLKISGRREYIKRDRWPAWDNTTSKTFLHRSPSTITWLHLKALPITDTQTLLAQSDPHN
ncbi:hypothetical protein PQX77_009434 [Marasmius sp. AFHP31]|nr:hypothetical protein PQX77_009434 [Marasmius sp. AFHP31]